MQKSQACPHAHACKVCCKYRRLILPPGSVGAVVLGIVMLVDAGYSGDWSRIGAITKDLETELKGIAPLVGAFHLLCAPIAGVVASRRGISTPKAVAKVGFPHIRAGNAACPAGGHSAFNNGHPQAGLYQGGC